MAASTTEARFQINNVKLYVPVVTLFINDSIEFLENLKQGQFLGANIGLKYQHKQKTII